MEWQDTEIDNDGLSKKVFMWNKNQWTQLASDIKKVFESADCIYVFNNVQPCSHERIWAMLHKKQEWLIQN